MNKWVKILGLGLILWSVPFFLGFPLFPLMQADEVFFKTIMIVVSTFLGMALVLYYFKNIKKNFVQEGVIVGIVWLVLNWVLDILITVPMAGMGVDRYFLEIGLRYLNAPIITIGSGYLLKQVKGK